MKVVHVGCGDNIIPNAVNIDYIRAFKYIRYPWMANIMCHMGLLSQKGYQWVKKLYPMRKFVKWGTATSLPIKDEDADIVYSSHMMEHLTHVEAEQFLKEVLRILKSGGGFRLVLPDLRHYINCYYENHDADEFLKNTYLASPNFGGIREKVRYLMYGNGVDRHSYMYDSDSACKFLREMGFRDINVLRAGETTLEKVEGLDLYERLKDSLYIECRK